MIQCGWRVARQLEEGWRAGQGLVITDLESQPEECTLHPGGTGGGGGRSLENLSMESRVLICVLGHVGAVWRPFQKVQTGDTQTSQEARAIGKR